MSTPNLVGMQGDSLREAFGKAISELARENDKIVLLDADIAGGTGVHHFRKKFPERFYQFGIAEQNMMSAASGMATTGLIPVVTTFAVFCLRAIEQCRLSIAYSNKNVKIVASHPGLDVGPDGASAQCLEDLAMFRVVPNMVVISPSDPVEMKKATEAMINYEGPVYMRTGRSDAITINNEQTPFSIGKANVLRDGGDIAIIATGVEVARALSAANILAESGVSCRVINMSTIKPIDREVILQAAEEIGVIVTAEDHNIIGGLGGAVSEVLAQYSNRPCSVKFVGAKDTFGESGEPDELAHLYKLDDLAIVEAAKQLLQG